MTGLILWKCHLNCSNWKRSNPGQGIVVTDGTLLGPPVCLGYNAGLWLA